MVKLTDLLRESDLGLTLKKGKTITVTHNKSGKEIVIVDKPAVRKEYEKIGYFVESINEAGTINVEPNWEGMWRFFKQMAKVNPNDWKRMERTLGSDWKKIDAMAKKNKWTESVNEAKTQSIDGEELLDYLQKRFKMSRKQAIASMKKHNMDVSSIKKESVNEGKWPDSQTARLLSQAFDDAKVKVQKVWEKGNHEYIIRVRAKDGWTNVRMELNVISNVIMMDTQSGHVKLGELQPGSRGRKLTKNLKMLSKIPSFGVAGFKGLKYKIESVNESGIMYRAGVKKYGLEGMKKIQSAAGKGLGHAEIGKIKDQYDKKRKKRESVSEGGTVEPKGNMAKIFKIVKDKQHAKIGGMLVDTFSASALVKIFDAVKDSNKEKLNKMPMAKLAYVLDKAFKSKVAV